MANIKVPIGRGIIGQVQQEKEETQTFKGGDFEFKQSLINQNRLITEFGTRENPGTVVTLTPPNGTTFVLISSCASAETASVAFTLNVTEAGTNRTLDRIETGIAAGGTFKFDTSFVYVVPPDTIFITSINNGATVGANLQGYFITAKRLDQMARA